MSLFLDHNPYPGVNAHLNSALQQNDGGWHGFHNTHITHLLSALDARLPPHYFVLSEGSLQVNAYDVETGTTRHSLHRPDARIRTSVDTLAPTQAAVRAADGVFALTDEIEVPDDVLSGLVIYRAAAHRLGQPVTRIELLSPANKPGGSDHEKYRAKREETLLSGIALVEIDYLHTRPPLVRRLPNYATREPHAAPYYITVIDPRPDPASGLIGYYAVDLLAALPAVHLPLANDETVLLDLNAVYQQTFMIPRLYRAALADYSQPPARFETFTPDDQTRIRALMARLADETAQP